MKKSILGAVALLAMSSIANATELTPPQADPGGWLKLAHQSACYSGAPALHGISFPRDKEDRPTFCFSKTEPIPAVAAELRRQGYAGAALVEKLREHGVSIGG